jgi:small nuclear ribonucleoprotein (snRNP)-like protein
VEEIVMKTKVVCGLLSFLFIASASMQCLAQAKDRASSQTIDQVKQQIVEAQKRDKRLIIALKNGETISGLVGKFSDTAFVVTKTHGIFGEGESVPVNYDDVVSIRGRNPFIKALKDIGSISVIAAENVVAMPLWLSLEGLSFLLHGEGLPSC